MEDSDTCPICWEEFKDAKLLNCRHTFCKPCLVDFQKKSSNKLELTCPLCRKVQILGKRGIEDVLNNYFVQSQSKEKHICNNCGRKIPVNEISLCNETVCSSCKELHANQKATDVESNDVITYCDDELTRAKFFVPSHLFLGQKLKTIVDTNFVTEFCVTSSYSVEEDGRGFPIRHIHFFENGTCDVIPFRGPEVITYECIGKEIKRRYFDNGITAIIEQKGRKLLSNFFQGVILDVDSTSHVKIFAETGDYQPSSIAFLNDDRVVCVGPHRRLREGRKQNMVFHGVLQIYDKKGNVLQEITSGADGPYFIYPMQISTNKSNNTMCISDQEAKSVFIFNENGNLINQYEGRSGPSDLFFRFKPRALCHTPDGNIIVGNMVDGSLHFLQSNGEFLGYFSADQSDFGIPSAISFDAQHRLWIGDANNRKIKVFELLSYHNFLEPLCLSHQTNLQTDELSINNK